MFPVRSLPYHPGITTLECHTLDRRTYRDSATGTEAHLSAGRVKGPSGQLWWSVTLLGDGDRAVRGLLAIVWCRTRAEARGLYRERLRALREAGFVRVV